MTTGLGHLLQDRIALTPERTAFRQGEAALSYGALGAHALNLGTQVQESGVGPGDRVAIVMSKGLEMPIAIHAIWRAGAVFVPLDTTAPPERLAGIIEDCGIEVLLTAGRNAALAAELARRSGARAITVDASLPPPPVQFAATPATADDLAYIIFTSGSTGRPKGIVHTHGSGLAFARMWADLYALRPDDVCFCTVPLHFDFSLADFLAIPIAGASTVLVPEIALNFPASLSALMQDSGATIWSTVPHAVLQLCEKGAPETRDLTALRFLIYGGEPLAPSKLPLVRAGLPRATISNSYGPAEVNQVSAYTVPADHPEAEPIPIGQPTAHATFIEDDSGELLVATPAMMRGYWNRPDLTNAAFVDREGGRYYRTGDMAHRGEDGLWRFSGRADRQVKLRGYRVELDEVERVLSAHPGVSEAAAVIAPNGLSLAAFVTCAPGAQVSVSALTDHAARLLPTYAVPAQIDLRPAFARTTTGKIDRRALREELS